MKRASYRDAIWWVAHNDDCEWTLDADAPMSVTSLLIADIFGVDDLKVRADITKAFDDFLYVELKHERKAPKP